MTTRDALEKAVADAEAELDAAKALTAVNAAATKLQRVKAELKELEGQAPVGDGAHPRVKMPGRRITLPTGPPAKRCC